MKSSKHTHIPNGIHNNIKMNNETMVYKLFIISHLIGTVSFVCKYVYTYRVSLPIVHFSKQ